MTIYAKRPGNNASVCVKIPIRHFEISLSCDDSCGAMSDLARSNLRVYSLSGDDYTGAVFGVAESGYVDATPETLEQAIAWCKASENRPKEAK